MIYFVGAGSGAADLITVRGKRYLEEADVIIYAGSLVNRELLSYAKEDCTIYNSAEMTLEEVIFVMEEAEKHQKRTVRLHTGDPSVYGAIREQMDILDKKGISYKSCPGVSACFGAAAALNLEYTLPGISQSLIITRMEGKTKVPEKESIESFAAHQASMAIYLSTGLLPELEKRLVLGGYGRNTPAVIVYKATWKEEEVYICTVSTLAQTAREHGITKTAIILIGEAISHCNYERSTLYSPDFETEFRTRRNDGERVKRIRVISFTDQGRQLAEKIKESLSDRKVELYQKPKQGLRLWAGEQFAKKDAIVFIGASGIAVRAIAPYVKDKLIDSPVLVLDEKGQYVIPLLSGHMGGANELAKRIADRIKATAIITTATDMNKKFAVDIFAKRNDLSILNREGIVKVSAKVLRGETITISIEHYKDTEKSNKSSIPKEVELIPYPPQQNVDVIISTRAENKEISQKAVLRLKLKEYVLGIGCKKGKTKEEISKVIYKNLEKLGLKNSDIAVVASIQKKKEEVGIYQWAEENNIPFITFSEEELRLIEGNFHRSQFVENMVGVDNVCERAALAACKTKGRLILDKQIQNGITLAVAKKKWQIEWMEEYNDET